MKDEFLYALRMFTINLIAVADYVKLKELLVEYRFMTSWEEDQQCPDPKLLKITPDSALSNLMNLVNATDEESNVNASIERSKVVRMEKVPTTVCGMEKREVF